MRRWKREAPRGFEFAILAPREIGQEGFRAGKLLEHALESLEKVGSELEATTAVFVAPADFAHNRANKAALKEFLGSVSGLFERIVVELPAWDPEEADSIASETGALATRDPLAHGASKRPTAYYRLPGPAGPKSRYEDPAIERLAEIAHEAGHEAAHYVFTNVDMFADAKRFKRVFSALE